MNKAYACFFDDWFVDCEAGCWDMAEKLQCVAHTEKKAKEWVNEKNSKIPTHVCFPKDRTTYIYHYREVELLA